MIIQRQLATVLPPPDALYSSRREPVNLVNTCTVRGSLEGQRQKIVKAQNLATLQRSRQSLNKHLFNCGSKKSFLRDLIVLTNVRCRYSILLWPHSTDATQKVGDGVFMLSFKAGATNGV